VASFRKFLQPDALAPSPSPEEIRKALTDLWDIVGVVPLTIDLDYTTTGKVALERIVATNEDAIEIKLDDSPADGDEVLIKRQNGQVTLIGNGNTIDGELNKVLNTKYDVIRVLYTSSGEEWSVMNNFSFPTDESGNVLVSSLGMSEQLDDLILNIKLLSERFEEAFRTDIFEGDVHVD